MSSSKIIKLADVGTAGVSEFSFKNIGPAGMAAHTEQGAGDFVPMGLFQGVDQQNSAGEEDDDTGPPTIEITEDDLNQRISAAFDDGPQRGQRAG